MWRAVAKGALLFAFGRVPGGARLYRNLTRERMGTQATHVDKLRRVWPGYVQVWRSRCGLSMDDLDIWVHEGGWTPFPLLVNYLLTGKGGVVTNTQGRVLDRYLARAVEGALTAELPQDLICPQRRRHLDPLRWCDRVEAAVAAVDGKVYAGVHSGALPLVSDSIDLCHSGGALEHYRSETLSAFLMECYRILRPGVLSSHVFDHRDHLRHADRQWPFLAHLALPGPVYTLLCGHPLLYHNRLLPGEIMALFESAGFERIAVRRLILPNNRYVEGDEALQGQPGLRRSRLASRFRHASDVDLRTAAAHYLYRKP